MRFLLSVPFLAGVALGGACTSGPPSSSAGAANGENADSSVASCAAGSPLPGAPYDITKSRFAFGSTPVAEDAGALTRWVGSDGALAIFANGSEEGEMNAGAPESNLPDWSSDTTALTAHASQYWESMGVAGCEIAATGIDSSVSGGGSIDGGSFQTTTQNIATLSRGIQGIRVVESLAAARFDVNDETTYETFYWPEIPADVVTTAIAFNAQLADPTALAAYKAKLPADAQGQGSVVIHHSSSFSTSPFQAAATYDVVETTPEDDGGVLSFDQNGNPVTTAW